MQCEPDSWGEGGRGEDAEEGGIILWHYCSHNGGRGRTKNATHSLSSSNSSSQSEARSRPTNTYLLFSIDEEGRNAEKRRDTTLRIRERASSNSFASTRARNGSIPIAVQAAAAAFYDSFGPWFMSDSGLTSTAFGGVPPLRASNRLQPRPGDLRTRSANSRSR